MPEGALPDIAVVVLAGGEATRLPGKLALSAGDLPLLARVVRNVGGGGRAVVLSCRAALPRELDELIDAPQVIDRWSRRGPLAGLLSVMSELHAPWVFAVAGDAPFIDRAFIDMLAARIEPGDEAVVPYQVRAGTVRREPLAALYLRSAFMQAGLPVLTTGNGSLHGVLDRLRVREIEISRDDRRFANINTPEDYRMYRLTHRQPERVEEQPQSSRSERWFDKLTMTRGEEPQAAWGSVTGGSVTWGSVTWGSVAWGTAVKGEAL